MQVINSIKYYLTYLYCLLIKFINLFIEKDNSIIFIPHHNCKLDGYDILNYASDNVLTLLNYLLSNPKYDGYNLVVVYHNDCRLPDYISYISSFTRHGSIKFILYSPRLQFSTDFLKSFVKSSYIFTASSGYNFMYKSYKQKVINLGYYTPFKDDSWVLNKLNDDEILNKTKIVNATFDYFICTSALSARIISTDLLLFYPKCIPLGFPRNDNLYHPNKDIRNQIVSLAGKNISKIICYTPTFRDYEKSTPVLQTKTIWGNAEYVGDELVNKILKEHNAIVVVKMHSWQAKDVLFSDHTCDNIIFYDELQKAIPQISLYDILSVSDALITDYTSTSFDYLHMDKPIIYYFYDYEKYNETRGFSYDPIDFMCAGPVAYTFSELTLYLQQVMHGEDAFKETRRNLHRLINKQHDDLASERILDFIIPKQ